LTPHRQYHCSFILIEDGMLKGKTALITGSTSGIGLATARALAQDGAHIMLNGFGDKAQIEKIRTGIEKEFGVKTGYSAADMTKPAEIADMIRATEKEFGALDVLVNNAGIQHVANIEDFPIEKWDAIIAVNLSSSFHTIRAAMPGMKARKWSHEGRRIGGCECRRDLQRHLPRVGANTFDPAADRHASQGLGQERARCRNSAALGETADAPVYEAREYWSTRRFPVQ
jgi:NAD(P)-dependent dehydrogenase (short-subunit alcohol dehydrogenase family)